MFCIFLSEIVLFLFCVYYVVNKVAAQADKISDLYGELQEASKAVLQLEAATSAQKMAQEGLEAAKEEISSLKVELAAEKQKTWFQRLFRR